MNVNKYYEFICDHCGSGNHPVGNSIKECIKRSRISGCVVTKDEYFCDKDCYDRYKKLSK